MVHPTANSPVTRAQAIAQHENSTLTKEPPKEERLLLVAAAGHGTSRCGRCETTQPSMHNEDIV